jgi:hypothetical protein
VQSPETYLGTFRAQYSQAVHTGKPWTYTAASHPYINDLQLQGEWRVENQKIVAGTGAHIVFRYVAPRIYVVAAPPAGAAGALSPNVDGKALRASGRARRSVPAGTSCDGRPHARSHGAARHEPVLVHLRLKAQPLPRRRGRAR